MEQISAALQKKIALCRTKVVLSSTFFATLLLGSKMHYVRNGEGHTPTAATDGKDYFLNVDYAEGQKPEVLKSDIKHEVIHKALLHVTRGKGRIHQLWNIAIDIVTNGILVKEGDTIDETFIRDKQREEMSSEEIYAEMLEEKHRQDNKKKKEGTGQSTGQGNPEESASPGKGQGKPEDPDEKKFAGLTIEEIMGRDNDHMAPAAKTSSEIKTLEADVQSQVATAITLAKQAGKAGSPLFKILAKIFEPKIDWKDKLREFIQAIGDDDFTFAKPNVRYLAHDIYMPSTYGFEIGPVAVIFDTSGSIYSYQKLVDTFASEINGILEDTNPEKLDVLYVDTKVAGHDTFDKGETFEPNLRGGGGTAFKEAFEYLETLDQPPVALVVFTDLEIYDLDQCECDIPTLWTVYGKGSNREVPFGQIVEIQDD